jgi:hypothetical protein
MLPAVAPPPAKRDLEPCASPTEVLALRAIMLVLLQERAQELETAEPGSGSDWLDRLSKRARDVVFAADIFGRSPEEEDRVREGATRQVEMMIKPLRQ